MNKLIILITLVAVSFSAQKWEYIIGVHINKVVSSTLGKDMLKNAVEVDDWIVLSDRTQKYDLRESGKPNPQLSGMNKMGQDGWELMFKEESEEGNYYYFKRKIY